MHFAIFILIFCLQQPALNTNDNLAIQGFDPVSYFSNDPRKGNSKYQSTFNTATYYFVSEENRRKFTNNPQKYEPEYGGWCAFAMGNDGTKVKVDPETFKIVDGKLYLFYNFLWTNTLPLWNENEVVLRAKADENWQETTKN
jgi:YHS domain-containing protein